MKRLLVLIAAAGLAVPVSAQARTAAETVPLDISVTACNGHIIQLTGALLAMTTVNTTPSGAFLISLHSQPQGVRGVDLQTGSRFIGTGVARETTVFLPAGGVVDTLVNQFHIQATAGGESFIVSAVFHITVNTNGDVAAVAGRFSATC